MRVAVDLCLIPIGVGVSLSKHVAVAIEVLRDKGLSPRTHAHGTSLEGEYSEIFAALEEAIAAVHAAGAPRVSTSIKLSSRIDRPQSDAEKMESIERRLRS